MPAEKGAIITVNLRDRRLYRAMQHAAIDLDESMRVFVVKALELRLEIIEQGKKAQEEQES